MYFFINSMAPYYIFQKWLSIFHKLEFWSPKASVKIPGAPIGVLPPPAEPVILSPPLSSLGIQPIEVNLVPHKEEDGISYAKQSFCFPLPLFSVFCWKFFALFNSPCTDFAILIHHSSNAILIKPSRSDRLSPLQRTFAFTAFVLHCILRVREKERIKEEYTPLIVVITMKTRMF